MTTPTDPIPEFKLGADRYARRGPGARAESKAHRLDPETQAVVETFEALYAELSSSVSDAATTPAAPADPDDDLQVDFPDEFESAVPAPDAVGTRAPQSARQLLQSNPAPARAQSGEVDTALNIDDAFAVLRAAETRGRARAEPGAVDAEEGENAVRAVSSTRRSSREVNSQPRYDASASAQWTTRARALWPKVAGAAAIALIVGTGVGYLVGRTPAPAPLEARIPITPQGGAQLQFDYELGQK